MRTTRTAVIIGGGIAGPVTAMALQKAGIAATIYEAYDQAAYGVGAGLNLAPNGMSALAIIGVDDLVRSIGTPTTRMVMENGNGKVLADIGTLPGLPDSYTCARADLYQVLLETAIARGTKVEYGKRFIGATDTGDGVVAEFADGTTVTGDVLIGADGIRSTVRTLIDPSLPQPRYSGLIGFGGWVDSDGFRNTNGAMHFAFGRKAFFGYQVDRDRAMWFSNLAADVPMTAAEVLETPIETWLSRLADLYAEDRIPARDMLTRVRPDDFVTTGALWDLPRVPVWHRGRIVLVGDSAHATSPSSGQGASQAIESSLQLARCLRDIAEPSQAFAAYESLRRTRVEKIIAGGARTNNAKAAGPVARLARDLLMPVALKTVMTPQKMFGWIHAYQIDWSTHV